MNENGEVFTVCPSACFILESTEQISTKFDIRVTRQTSGEFDLGLYQENITPLYMKLRSDYVSIV
jgi:hypothetical protein